MRTILTKWFLILLGVLLGTLFIVMGIQNYLLAKESSAWPRIEGKLVSESQSKRKKLAMVFYEYQVNGIRYENSRVNFRNDKTSKNRIRDKYQIGDVLGIYYKPDEPEISVLEPGASFFYLILKLFGGVFCFGFSIMMLFSKRR
jgi:hypothetical protein